MALPEDHTDLQAHLWTSLGRAGGVAILPSLRRSRVHGCISNRAALLGPQRSGRQETLRGAECSRVTENAKKPCAALIFRVTEKKKVQHARSFFVFFLMGFFWFFD